MRGILIAAIAMAVAWGPLHAQEGPAFEPPEQWREYFEAVLAAEQIEDGEARCRAYPDLPGNRWPAGTAQARCALLREPMLTLDEVDALLDAEDGILELDRRYAELLRAHYEDPGQREQIFVAYDIFDAEPRAGEVAARWLRQAPDSAFANVARAQHLYNAGWKARGGAWASETPPEQFERMHELFAESLPLFARALELQQDLSVACVRLMGIGNATSVRELEAIATQHCMSVDPDGYHFAVELVGGHKPKWGGSDEGLRYAVAYAQARVVRNPILGLLAAEAAVYRAAQEKDYGSVADELAEAARMAPHATNLRLAGRGQADRGDDWAAVAYYSQSFRFLPTEARTLYSRFVALDRIPGGAQWAIRDLRRAVALKPGDASYNFWLARLLHNDGEVVAARPYYLAARSDAEFDHDALWFYCTSFIDVQDDLDALLECSETLAGAYPEFGTSWMVRALALVGARDPDAPAAVARFRELADARDPRQEAMLEYLTSQGW